MTPEQIDTATNAVIELHSLAAEFWPHTAYLTATAALWWALARIQRRRRARGELRQAIRRLESFANHPGARQLLDDIHNQPRKEDQP